MLVDAVFEFIRPVLTLKSVFLAAGAPHFDLALRAAGYVERVYAVDAPILADSRRVIRPKLPPNVVPVQSSAGEIPVPAGTVNVAFSGELEALPAIHRTLAPGGLCFCVARGREAGTRVREAGFSKVTSYAGRLRVPPAFLNFLDGYRVVAVK